MAAKVREDGAVAALCAASLRPIDLRGATWTMSVDAVTCSRCRRKMREARPRQRSRRMQGGLVEIRPGHCGGEPTIAGTRITTKAIGSLWRRAYSIPSIQRLYPDLTEEQIGAAIDYEARRRIP